MIKVNDLSVNALSTILDKIDYVFIIKSLRGYLEFFDPWSDFEKMIKVIDTNLQNNKSLIKLLCLGIPMSKQEEDANNFKNELDILIDSNILVDEGTYISTNNYCVVVYQGLKLLTELNPWYKTCKNKDTDIYIGLDSLRLAENIKFDVNGVVLDLCSGTGIQGLLAARSAKKVISVELNPKAINVIEFNSKMNGLNDIIEIREGDLYSVLNDEEKFSAIYVNPPFIPMIEDVEYPICGAGGEDGLSVLKKIITGLDSHLYENGETIIFCQCLGDNNNIFFDKYVNDYSQKNKWSLTSLVIDKVPAEYQINMLGKLTKLFNDGLDVENFNNKMSNIYKQLNAAYLYTVIYKIRKSNIYSTLKIELQNKWGLEDYAQIKDGIEFLKDNKNFEVHKKGVRIGFVDIEAKKMFELLSKNHNVKEAIDYLHTKKDNDDIQCKAIQICRQMEEIGMIARKNKE